MERELADPASRRARVLFELKALLRQRQASAAFHPAGRCEVVSADPRVLALRRSSPDAAETVLCLHNVSADTVRAEGRVLGPYQVLWSPEP
jgi:sucrose phosphorylase